jgi:hypothetical protein
MHTWVYHLHHLIVASVICQVANNKLDFVSQQMAG